MQSRMVALECHVSCMERTNPKNLNVFGFTELMGLLKGEHGSVTET